MRPARRTDNCAALVVPNVKVGWGRNTPSYLLSLRGLLRESFTFSDIIYYHIITRQTLIEKSLKDFSQKC